MRKLIGITVLVIACLVISVPISHFIINKHIYEYIVLKEAIEKYSVHGPSAPGSEKYRRWYMPEELSSVFVYQAFKHQKRMVHYIMLNESFFFKLWIPNRVDDVWDMIL